MPRILLACSLVLALAAPAGAAEAGGTALDRHFDAMLSAQPPLALAASALPSGLAPRDPRVAAAWSALPALTLALLAGGASLATDAALKASLADQDARGIPPVDQTFPELPLTPYANLVFLAPLTFGGGQFYAGDPLRGTLVTLGGPLAILGGAAASVLVMSLVPHTATPAGQVTTNPALRYAMTGGILISAVYGAWATWDAYHLVAAQGAQSTP